MINLHANHPEPIYLQSAFHLLLLYFTLNPPWRGKASGYCWKCWHRRWLVTSLIFQEEEVVGTLEERPDGRKTLQSSLGTDFIHLQPERWKPRPLAEEPGSFQYKWSGTSPWSPLFQTFLMPSVGDRTMDFLPWGWPPGDPHCPFSDELSLCPRHLAFFLPS